MKLLEFFQETNGQLSNVRLLSTLCVFTALFMVINGVIHGQSIATDTMIVLLSAGFGGKIAQKAMEAKEEQKP